MKQNYKKKVETQLVFKQHPIPFQFPVEESKRGTHHVTQQEPLLISLTCPTLLHTDKIKTEKMDPGFCSDVHPAFHHLFYIYY